MASQKNLAAIAYESNLQKACSCGKDVTIRAVSTAGSRIEGIHSVWLHPTSSDLITCGHSDCPLEMSPGAIAWVMTVTATYRKLRETKCDNCFLLKDTAGQSASHKGNYDLSNMQNSDFHGDIFITASWLFRCGCVSHITLKFVFNLHLCMIWP